MGAWIETQHASMLTSLPTLLPLWEHGLKLLALKQANHPANVAPFMGAWIETA